MREHIKYAAKRVVRAERRKLWRGNTFSNWEHNGNTRNDEEQGNKRKQIWVGETLRVVVTHFSFT